MGGGKAIFRPVTITSTPSFQCNLLLTIGRSISNKDHLINFLFFVEALKQHFKSFISPSPFGLYIIKESFEIYWSGFKASSFNNFIIRAIVVAIHHNFDFNSRLKICSLKNGICFFKGIANNFASLF
jgi:hypothetical protein